MIKIIFFIVYTEEVECLEDLIGDLLIVVRRR